MDPITIVLALVGLGIGFGANTIITKKKMGDAVVEIYVHTSKKRKKIEFQTVNYEIPLSEFIDVDTTFDTPSQSFSNIINYLTSIHKL